MILSKKVIIKWNAKTKGHYINLGYLYTKMGDKFEVKVEDLTDGSNVKIDVKCDGCNNKLNIIWQYYLKYVKKDGEYYCLKCARNNYKKFISFEQWCIENNRQDVLDRWDYELNGCKSNEITYATNKKYYFKCPNQLHPSELKKVNDFTTGRTEGSIGCKACNSFAQWGIDNICSDFLEKYWDWEKNMVDPWEISYSSNKYIYIKCQNKNYHENYRVMVSNFINGNRCPYCNKNKIHKLDSLGNLYPEVLELWSDKNKKTPYDYAPKSDQIVFWKCPDGEHKDFKRGIYSSNLCNFRCPECQYSKGEKRIEKYFKKNNIPFVSQKEFNNLVGVKGRNLSYDFYLPQYNLLIEYQGEFHDGNGNYYVKQNLKCQQEHDKRKREYAQINNIKFLEIWYWDYDNIEKILDKEFLEV